MPAAAGRRRTWVRRVVLVMVVVLTGASALAIMTYHRQIWSYSTRLQGAPSESWPFPRKPAGETSLMRLAVAGDVGDSGPQQSEVSAAMSQVARTQPYDALLLLGDNVYPYGDPTQLPQRVFEPFAPVLEAGAELLAILGNHDVLRDNGEEQIARLGMPGRWWAQEAHDVLLIGLDSTQPDNPEQLAFLERTLSRSQAKWRIVAVHHPPYSAGYQGSNLAVRETFSPVFARFHVQLVLSGHDHDFQRSVPLSGVTYVVSGGGATSRRTASRSFTAVSYSTPHFTDITVYPDRLLLRAVDRDTHVFDDATLPVRAEGP